MNRPLFFRLLPILGLLILPGFAQAQTAPAAKTLLATKIAFGPDGNAKVSYDAKGQAGKDVDGNKIESTLVFYAFAMSRLDSDSGKVLLNQVQASISKVATEQGMVRADILKGNPVMKPLQDAPAAQTIDLIFSEAGGKAHSLEMKPETIDIKFLAPATMALIQDQVKGLSESGLRLMVLAMGGMNKWYREVGKASDPDSLVKAPAYGLNLALDILEKLSGKKKN